MSERDERVDLLCQLVERGGSRRLLDRDGARLRFGSSKDAHEKRMIAGVMIASLLAAMTVPLLFLQVEGWLTAALGLVAAAMIALVVVPLVGRQEEIWIDLDERTVSIEKRGREVYRAQAADVRVFFHRESRHGDADDAPATVSLRRSGDRAERAMVLADELDASMAREVRDLLQELLRPPGSPATGSSAGEDRPSSPSD